MTERDLDQRLTERLSEPYMPGKVVHIGDYFINRGFNEVIYGYAGVRRLRHLTKMIVPQLANFIEEI